MPSYRCSQCNTNWPKTGEYRKCPDCLIPTWSSNNDPIDAGEATSRRNFADFERYAKEWDAIRALEEENEIANTKEAPAKPDGECCLCGAAIRSSWCRHPWGQPFDKWPEPLRAQLYAAAPFGFDPDPERRK